MAGGKGKKKKPAANPARGFATTSIASKPRTTETAEAENPASTAVPKEESRTTELVQSESSAAAAAPADPTPAVQISPEEFERQLEESELQNLVEKHAQKAKREAARQISRLETDRRVLRTQADFLNTRRWLPPELMDEILDLVRADARLADQVSMNDNSVVSKISDEDLTIRLWILQQTLKGVEFPEAKITKCLQWILDLSTKIVGSKDSIWGLEEALEWLARECSREELPVYDNVQRHQKPKIQTGELFLLLISLTFSFPNVLWAFLPLIPFLLHP